MRLILLLLFFLLSYALSFAQLSINKELYEQLCMVNKEWEKYHLDKPLAKRKIDFASDEDLIQAHLMIVEQKLRQKDISHLSPAIALNRQKNLDFLHEYRKRKLFPKNLYHKERKPYFIDDFGTACAVGYLVINTGHSEFAECIRKNNNYAYLAELNSMYPQLKKWADANGFTIDELALIQPTYGGGGSCSLCSSAQVFDASCYGSCDGYVCLPDPLGTPPYLITGPSCSNLCAGTYTWTIEDSDGTTTTYTYTINEPPLLSASITSSTNVSCNGYCDGQATVTASGGITPYSYLWSNSTGSQITPTATGLCAGTHSVTITDANFCTITVSASITQPSSTVSVSITSKTDVSCYGGSNGAANLNVTGGTPGYTYEWSDGQTNGSATALQAGIYTVTVTDVNLCTAITSVTISEPSADLTVSVLIDNNVSCFAGSDGQATATTTGGTTPYAYQWFTFPNQTTATATGLAANSYTVMVTDANLCTASTSITITQPTTLSTGYIYANISCNGACDGSADLSVTGGTTPYNYNWSNGSTTEDLASLCAGVFDFTVTDANLCTAAVSITISEPAVLSASITGTDVNCNGTCDGTADLSVSGGTAAYSYNWSNGSTTEDLAFLCAGIFDVTVTDSNLCTAASSVMITEPAEIMISLTSSDISCNGLNDGSATAIAAGGTSPYVYLWSQGSSTNFIISLSAGTYQLTVSDTNNCSIIDSVLIEEPESLVISATTDTSSANLNDGSIDITVNGGISPYSYEWSNGQSTEDLVGVFAGEYSVTVTDGNSCIVTDTFTVEENVGIYNELEIKHYKLRIVPNPSSGIVSVNWSALSSNCKLVVYDLTGRNVKNYVVSEGQSNQVIDVSSLNGGVYFVRLFSNEKEIAREKMVVE